MSKDLTDALRELMEKNGQRDVETLKPRGSASRVTSAAPTTAAEKKTGGGIASPLTETAFADRTYHPQTVLTTSDGFLSIVLRPLNKVKFTDANGDPVEIIYKAPV